MVKKNFRPQARDAITREPIRQGSRPGDEARPLADRMKRGEAIGFDGEVITRMRDSNQDPFHIERSEIPDGFDMEWKRVTCVGKTDRANIHKVGQAGWRPVPSSMFPGRWHEADHDGPIEFEGMALMIRPMKLTLEAKEDDHYAAQQQLAEARGEFKFKSPDKTRYNPDDPQAKGLNVMRSEIVGSPTTLYPSLEIAGDDDA
jgi:hypothetical protein